MHVKIKFLEYTKMYLQLQLEHRGMHVKTKFLGYTKMHLQLSSNTLKYTKIHLIPNLKHAENHLTLNSNISKIRNAPTQNKLKHTWSAKFNQNTTETHLNEEIHITIIKLK